MDPAHRSLRTWLRDLFKPTKPSAATSESKPAGKTTVGAAESVSEQPADLGHPRQSAENEEQPDTIVPGNCLSGTQTHISTDSEKGPASAKRRVANDSRAANPIDNVEEDQATNAAKSTLGDARPMRPGISRVSSGDNESPIWLKSIENFEKKHPKEYKLMVGELKEIQKLKDGHTWDTWLNRQDLDKESTETNYKLLRTCKAYMPSLATARVLALNLANLDPHKVAPLVTAGVFVLVELCFGLIDPSTRDESMGLLLKTNIVINKWVSREGDLRRMTLSDQSSMQRLNEMVAKIEEGLGALYFDSLVLMSEIYGAGRSGRGRLAASVVFRLPEWKLAYQKIQNTDSAYGELKSQVESMVKTKKDNSEVLDWIRSTKEDPEPLHQTVKERTGVNVPSSTGGIWFVNTSEFTSWVDGISHNIARPRVFWLKGSMGMGKTTLLCRTIYHFESYPIHGVKFVPYYCHGSGSGSGPRYETILRALCCRLAWRSDGSIAEPAMQLYHPLKVVPDAQMPGKTTWEQLLRDLIASHSSNSIKIVFVLDALDECETLGDYVDLLKFLTDLPPHPDGPFFLVSSRPHVPVWKYFGRSVQTFEVVQDETMNEIQIFIQNQIQSKKKEVHWEESIFCQNPEMLEELSSALLESAGGMFRWVEIWIGIFFPRNKNAVRRQGKSQERLNCLKNLKSVADLQLDENDTSGDDRKKMALTEAYKKLWHINSDYGEDKDLQTRLFQIITASFESLTPQGILEAVCFDSSTPPDHYEELHSDHVAGLYSSFLRVNREGYLEYEHLSAKIFVEEMKDSNKRPFSSQESHRTMAEIAICAIERPSHRIWIDANIDLVGQETSPKASSKDTDKTLYLDPSRFASYLFRFWLQHCQVFSQEEHFIQKMSNLIRCANTGFEGWIVYSAEERYLHCNTFSRVTRQEIHPRRPIPFLCMVSFGFSPISHNAGQPALLQGFEDREARNLDGETPLHIACHESNSNIVEDLLKLEYAIQGSYSELLSAKDFDGRIPLHLARDRDVIKILLQYELPELRESPASQTSTGPRKSQLLHVRDNKDSMAIETILMRDSNLATWILQRSLLETQALREIFSNAISDHRADERAAGIVKVLLENGVDPNMKVDGHRSVLSFALWKYKAALAKQLLDHGAVLEGGEEVTTAFYRAVGDFDLEMLDVLHSGGVSMDTDYKVPGLKALSKAVTTQRLDVIGFLLKRGANAHRTTGAGNAICRTVLHRAVSMDNIEMAKLLVGYGADVNASPANFSTPLASAVSRGNREMAEFLIDEGADARLLSTSDKEALDAIFQR